MCYVVVDEVYSIESVHIYIGVLFMGFSGFLVLLGVIMAMNMVFFKSL